MRQFLQELTKRINHARKGWFCLLFAVLLGGHTAFATHLRAADIKVEQDCSSDLTFRITVIAYLNTLSNTRFGTNSQVFFGDGSFVQIPMSITIPRPELGKNVGTATFTVTHTYLSYGTYSVAYQERDRSSGVVNITNSDDVAYVTFVNFTIDPRIKCNRLPILSVPPLDRACHTVSFLHTSGAYDVDGDSLSYELSVPANSPTTFADYSSPISSKFYTNFSKGNEDGTAAPVFFINPLTGLLTWDAPGMIGEYNIAFKIVEWRKDSISGQYLKLSTTTRDMQIIVEECQNTRPTLIVPNDTCIVAGSIINALIVGRDEEKHPVKIEVFSEVIDFDPNQNPATYSPQSPVFRSSDPQAELRFNWSTSCLHVRQQPYQVVFKITDDPIDGPKLVDFKVWNIKVVAPAPVWKEQELDLVKRSAVLEWKDYSCPNASAIQIWRKVDSYPYSPGLCNTGLPKFLGYNLIAEVPSSQTKFSDTDKGRGLVVGATYCYRIMAYFKSPASTPSLVSTEICVGPIQADAPVITHVSVEKTSIDDGKIRVSWRSPFNINGIQFPKPYEYEVYRANGFIGDTSLLKVGRVTDTTFVDSDINTMDKVFNYRIILYSKPQHASALVPVDTSANASSVRLSAVPGVHKIELAWRDSVPWSNVVQSKPFHLIYRGIENTDPTKMILIDSVNVTINGFNYSDAGQYQNKPIEDDKRYSYRIETRGTYGNPKIAKQVNYSQTVTTYPKSDLLPCRQVIEINLVNCEEYMNSNNCGQSQFSNTIFWTLKDLGGCRKDINGYNIYAASRADGNYELIAKAVKDTFYIESGLPSFARCYRVSALDNLGRESVVSDSVCNDNCPYYLLPNVFTPNDDDYNDSFSANFDLKQVSGVAIRCPRFVTEVNFKVYDRWGKSIYTYNSMDGGSTSIEWNGRDSNEREVPGGVYFYTASVTFDVLNPNQQKKEIKGWVHLIR